MAEPGDPDWDESVHAFQQDLAVDLADVAAARRTIHLMWPSLEHAGRIRSRLRYRQGESPDRTMTD